MITEEEMKGAMLGYTLATGRLFAPMAEFHRFAEDVAGQSIFTHEFGDLDVWASLRAQFEVTAKERMQ